ncbi:MAG: hypothetical protein KAJ19_18555 [Gammaproteobacteria bacterium]|nr:hypothetical protein [Gammaproteobacteria bacterium]
MEKRKRGRPARKKGEHRKKAPKKIQKKAKPKAKAPVKSKHFDHAKNCTICKHPQCKEIEKRFTKGDSSSVLAEAYGVLQRSLNNHILVLSLRDKFDYSTLGACERIIRNSRIYQSDKPSSDALVGKALELRAKVTEELIERHEHRHKGTVTLNIRDHISKQLKNGHASLRKPPPTEAEIDEAVNAAKGAEK